MTKEEIIKLLDEAFKAIGYDVYFEDVNIDLIEKQFRITGISSRQRRLNK